MWERATFTVPIDISEDRVRDVVPKYIRKWMGIREKQGWRLFSRISFDPVPRLEGDRKRYFLWANIDREPKERKIQIPDNLSLIQRLIKRYKAKLS